MIRDALLLQEVHQLDLAVFTEVPLQLLLVERIKVFDVANVDVPCRARVHRKRQSRWQRARVLAPADLQPAVVESETLIRSDLEEGESRRRVDEGHELI